MIANVMVLGSLYKRGIGYLIDLNMLLGIIQARMLSFFGWLRTSPDYNPFFEAFWSYPYVCSEA